MECANCYCSVIHGRFCTIACRIAKNKETARLDLTSNINALLEKKKEQEDYLDQAEEEARDFTDCRHHYDYDDEEFEVEHARLKKEAEKCKLELKITKFSIIIGISIRDKKGTYPQLKSRYSEVLEDYMSLLTKSGELCEIADLMKGQYESYEFLYNILK